MTQCSVSLDPDLGVSPLTALSELPTSTYTISLLKTFLSLTTFCLASFHASLAFHSVSTGINKRCFNHCFLVFKREIPNDLINLM